MGGQPLVRTFTTQRSSFVGGNEMDEVWISMDIFLVDHVDVHVELVEGVVDLLREVDAIGTWGSWSNVEGAEV